MKELGETETDVSVVDLSEADEKLLNVALNKIKGDWDYDCLSGILKEFAPDEAKLSGFSAQEIAILCADANAASGSVIEIVAPVEDYDGDEDEDSGEIADDGEHGAARAAFDFDGASWVVCMIFPDPITASDWLTAHGYPAAKPGTRSTVIRVE